MKENDREIWGLNRKWWGWGCEVWDPERCLGSGIYYSLCFLPFAKNQKAGNQEICFLRRQQAFTVWMLRFQKYNRPRRFLLSFSVCPGLGPAAPGYQGGGGRRRGGVDSKLKYFLSPLAPLLCFHHQSSHLPRTFIQFCLRYNWYSLVNRLLHLLVFLLCHLFYHHTDSDLIISPVKTTV